MYRIFRTKSFEKSFRKLKRSGELKPSVVRDLEEVIDTLVSDGHLPANNRDHALKGALKEYRECHIKGDLLLIYRKEAKNFILLLVDIGSHSYLFG